MSPDTRQGKDLMGTFIADLVLQILSFVAQNEHEYIRKRQSEGIVAAKAKGVKFGRPPFPLPDNFHAVHKAWRMKNLTLKQAAAACNMPVGTFYSKVLKLENTTLKFYSQILKSCTFSNFSKCKTISQNQLRFVAFSCIM